MKFKLKDFRLVEAFSQSIKMMKKIILESLDDSIAIPFLFNRLKRAFDRLRDSQPIETRKTKFSIEFFGICSKYLKRF